MSQSTPRGHEEHDATERPSDPRLDWGLVPWLGLGRYKLFVQPGMKGGGNTHLNISLTKPPPHTIPGVMELEWSLGR